MASNMLRASLLCLLIVCGTYNPVAADYTHALGWMYVHYAAAAYCQFDALYRWDCKACKEAPNLQSVTTLYSKSHNVHGYVGYSSSTNEIVVGFKGTTFTDVRDLVDDGNFWFTDYPNPACAGCSVHRGFLHAYQSVESDLSSAVGALLRYYPGATISVTGHSLGGAIAVLCSMDLTLKGLTVNRLVTFGCPRVGNAAFVNQLAGRLGESYRLTHAHDVVPHVPFKAWGFRHLPTEIFYNEANTRYQVCSSINGEDDSCSNSNTLNTSTMDHFHYVGIKIDAQC